MRIRVGTTKRVCIIEVAGRLTFGDADGRLCDEVARRIDAGERRLVLDASRLSLIDSAGVGEIVATYQLASARGALIRVALPSGGPIHRVFRVSGLDRALEIFEHRDEAIASYLE
ncbi:MAG TPA: STAS domain-containing protein [Candidatus Polarisedimenticolaceae bacterium]|nr:STAS domain-containing protein [Candidatus Polarisedimenticolaceae bacterium]